MSEIENRLRSLSNMSVIPNSHILYLKKIKEEYNFEPEVIYDIGACVLHWTKEASKIWKNSLNFFYFCAILLQTGLLLPSSSFSKNVPTGTGTGTEKYLSNAEFHIML